MRRLLLVAIGGGIGYVLGAKAGRPAYDRMVENWERATGAMGLDRAASKVGDATADVRDAARDSVGRGVQTMADSAATSLHDAADQVRSSTKHSTPSGSSSSLGA